MKVIVLATSPKTRGGISSVIHTHMLGPQWGECNCVWIPTHIDKGYFIKLIYYIGGILKFLSNVPNADIVHVHLSEPLSAIRKSIFVYTAKVLKKKVIIHFHSFSPDTTILGKYSKVYYSLFSKADIIIVLSNYWKEIVNSTFGLDKKVVVLFNACTPVQDNINFEKEKYILYAGALNKRKGYADLIKAFSTIASDFPEWKIVLAGNGEIQEGRLLSQELGIKKQTIFLGWVAGEEKDEIYRKASVFCLPSYAEGFPMAVLDAWAYGLPVVTTPVGGIPDIAIDGENILLFNAGDIKMLSSCLRKLISSESLRKSLSTQSHILASTTFNVNTINSQLREIYYSLIDV